MDDSPIRESLPVRWFVIAKQYMMAANAVLHSAEYSRPLFMPTLHLTGQGIEVLLKANLIAAGRTTADVKKFGHNIWALWNDPLNANLRSLTLIEARGVWERAKAQPGYCDAFTEDPDDLLPDYLEKLGVLHSAESGFALRYVTDGDRKGPRPFLLAETFLEIADIGLKRPADLRL